MSSYNWTLWDSKCRWPIVVQEFDIQWDSNRSLKEFKDRVRWIYENTENPERHCRWDLDYPEMKFRFRHDRDLLMFSLRWL